VDSIHSLKSIYRILAILSQETNGKLLFLWQAGTACGGASRVEWEKNRFQKPNGYAMI
jgi:hypothetical protein